SGLPLTTIEELQKKAERLCGVPKEPKWSDKVACVIEYRDGTVIDVVRGLKS
ncbi:MAG: citrate lyase subunit alpha, partial [Thermoplasmata archaeon]